MHAQNKLNVAAVNVNLLQKLILENNLRIFQTRNILVNTYAVRSKNM